MADESGQKLKSRVCPFLGLERDRSSHHVIPADGHRCYAAQAAVKIDSERQSYYCLSGRFELCPRRVLGAPEEIVDAVTSEEGAVAEPQARERAGVATLPRVVVVAGALVVIGLLALGVSWTTGSGLGASTSQSDAAPVAAPASPIPPSAASATSEPTSTLQPVSSQSTAPPVASPANPPGKALAGGSLAVPTPTAPPPSPSPTVASTVRTYLVPYGDTLGNISARFGVPVEEIMKANNIPNQDVILAGRTIVIP